MIAVAIAESERYTDIIPAYRTATFALLVECAALSLMAYFSTYFVDMSSAEIGNFDEFVIDFTSSPLDTTTAAIGDLQLAASVNRKMRRVKRVLVAVATILLFIAVACVIASRATTLTAH